MQKIISLLENTTLLIQISIGLLLFLLIFYLVLFFWWILKNKHRIFPQNPAFQTKECKEKLVRDVVIKVSRRDHHP